MNLIQVFLPEGIPCDTKKNFPVDTEEKQPSCVTIHWIGPYPGQSVEDVRYWWETGGGEASAHYIIKDNDVLQCWPIEKMAWHAGCTVGNVTSLGIELCPQDEQGRFSQQTLESLKELLDTIDPKRKLPLCRHYDWTAKDCPLWYVEKQRWLDLLQFLGRKPVEGSV